MLKNPGFDFVAELKRQVLESGQMSCRLDCEGEKLFVIDEHNRRTFQVTQFSPVVLVKL